MSRVDATQLGKELRERVRARKPFTESQARRIEQLCL